MSNDTVPKVGSSPASVDALREDIDDLPPSAKLVFIVLQHETECTQSELADETLLPQRTIRYAIERLKKEDVITAQLYIPDARKTLYSLSRQEER